SRWMRIEISIFCPNCSSRSRSSPTETLAAPTSTAMTMVKEPWRIVWEMSRILTLCSASRAQTAAMMPTLSC
ncbi:2-oxoglutarate ferredoxin oxidoreductase subunit delta, partial [Dysosmobacter welbionis]